MREIQIRTASTEDAYRLLEIYTPYVTDTAISFEYTVPTEEEFANRIRKTLEKYPYLVAVREGKIIGYAYAGPFVGREAYNWSAEMSIYVDMNERKTGAGGKLYAEMEHILRKMNITNLEACIGSIETPDEHLNNNSIEFHTHMGYRMVGEFKKCGYKFGRWYNMAWMEKIIAEHPQNAKSIRSYQEVKNV